MSHPIAGYFALTYAISWTGALTVAAPALLRHESLPTMTGLLMFPAMLLGPGLVGLVMTAIIDGKRGVRDLFFRMSVTRGSARWCVALLIPPAVILGVLCCLQTFVSPVYAPNRFLLGVLFGLPAGLLEEIGWTGYAFPRMRSPDDALTPAVVLGLLWGVWHWPVIDFLGTATPHGSHWIPFFLAFTLVLTAMRVVIAWVFINTNSLLLAQLLHASSTGSLVVFSPVRATPAQEAGWYAVYGAALWMLVACIAVAYGKRLTRPGQ